jgi:hypothetical protein
MIKMDCKKIRENIFPFVTQEVTQAERAQMLKHIASCPDCRSEANKAEGLDELLLDAHGYFKARIRTAKENILEAVRTGRAREIKISRALAAAPPAKPKKPKRKV